MVICCARLDLRPVGPVGVARLANDRVGKLFAGARTGLGLEGAPRASLCSCGCRHFGYCRISDGAEHPEEVELSGFGTHNTAPQRKQTTRSHRRLLLGLEATRGSRSNSSPICITCSAACAISRNQFAMNNELNQMHPTGPGTRPTARGVPTSQENEDTAKRRPEEVSTKRGSSYEDRRISLPPERHTKTKETREKALPRERSTECRTKPW